MTGAGGFLCRGLITPFEEHGVDLRLMDVCDFDIDESKGHEKIIGDVSREDDVANAVDGVDAIVIAHMASRQAGAYDEVALPFDANIKGTALLFAAAVKAGIKNIVLISSAAAVMHEGKTSDFNSKALRVCGAGSGMYGLTKACQEVIAEHFAIENKLCVAAIRTGYIHDMDSMCDKYGKKAEQVNSQYADRRDIGEVARLALQLDGPRYEILYAYSTPEAENDFDVKGTKELLNWKPKYTYEGVPR